MKKTTFVVDRNFKDVGKTFGDRARTCINDRAVVYNFRDSNSASSVTNRYTARAIINVKRAELYIQESRGGIRLYREPEGGAYVLVTDATPISKSKTRIDIYHQRFGHDLFVTAITNWARGNNLGCPDLTKL